MMNARNHENASLTDVEMAPLKGQTTATGSSMSVPEIKRVSSNTSAASSVGVLTQGKGGLPSLRVIYALSMYTCCSVGMVLTNKSLASSYDHYFDGDLNVLLVVFQAITASVCAHVCKKMNLIEYPAFDMKVAKQWAPVNILFCLMLFTGMAGLKHNNVPMVTVFKNVTNIFTTFGENYFFGTKTEFLVYFAFGIMLAGAVAAAWNDINLTPIGLFWMSANCLCTAAYVLSLKFATRDIKLPKFGMVFYNNVLCTFFLLPAASIMGQTRMFYDTTAVHTFEYFFKNFMAGFIGFFLNFASLNCVQVTGPTTYAIVGSLNKIPTTILGYFIFNSQITGETWFFISVSMCGGFVYSFAKLRGSQKKGNK